MTRPRRALACALATVPLAALLLAGCTSPEPMPTPSTSRTATAAPTPTPTPTPELHPEGTASDNQAFFDHVNRALIDSGVALNGAAFVDNLVANGFVRADMEVTPDVTAIGVGADNIVFSVRFGDTCLLGQWGNIGYTSLTTAVLSTGRCIVGTARPA
ncbi:DUF6993 domain-containing protein [Protaetiibacter mangrovi]|uniref:DUF6993 domain-containing protein n=1 Tax=Protaetiibacter mangrovi TaxID=2970926 RepID=A0ABT1ZEC8_9MICO|nr:hypothetical protein [Protaetiibacter mangrovi]MCS0499057.1 hypothetical protein [Protaetiibacter mangrovi]TPX02842.1 hypothetical protein FJ656_20295 [Schumannella luteola]